MTVADFILSGRERLRRAGLQCADPLLHMKQITELGLGISAAELIMRWDEELGPEALGRLEAILSRRLAGEPFQYIAGFEWFWDSRFRVGPGVLIPRRETELLVETLLRRGGKSARVAELGAGSGNIGLSVLKERPLWEWHAFEKNPDSLGYLEANRAALLPPIARYWIHRGDFFELAAGGAPYDWVVANPPYVKSAVLPTLAKEIQHEPRLALDGGARGIEVLSRLVDASRLWLGEGGWLLSEIGSDQGEEALALLAERGFADPQCLLDYAGLARVVLARKA